MNNMERLSLASRSAFGSGEMTGAAPRAKTAFELLRDVVRRRRGTIATIIFVGAIGGGVLGLALPKEYTSTATVPVELISSRSITPDSAATDADVDTAIAEISSKDSILRALQSLDPSPDAGPSDTEQAYEALKRKLRVFQTGRSRMLTVSAALPEAHRAARFVNALIEGVILRHQDSERASIQSELAWLSTRLPELKRQADEAFLAQQDPPAPAPGPDSLAQQVSSLSDQIAVAKAELERAQTLPDHNDVTLLSQRVKALEARERVVRAAVAMTRRAELEKKQAADRAAMLDQVYREQLRRKTTLTETLAQLPGAPPRLDLASVPLRPSSVPPIYILPPIFLLSVIVGLFVATIKETSDDRLRSDFDIAQAVKMASAGFIPKLPTSRKRLSRVKSAEQKAGEALIEGVAGALLRRTADQDSSRVFLIASSLPAEGRSFVSAELAKVCTRSGKPSIIIQVGMRGTMGAPDPKNDLPHDEMIEALGPGCQVSRHSRDGIPYIHVEFHSVGFADSVSRGDMREAIQLLKRQFEVVLIDAPPLVIWPECASLSNEAEKTLFIVRWQKTRAWVAQSAAEVLRRSHDSPYSEAAFLSVTNCVNLKRHAKFGFSDRAAVMYKNFMLAKS